MPSGTVTFLFSDIEGSTRRWETDREAMRAALEQHDTLMRSAVLSNHGYVFKTVGDAFCCTFAHAPDALRAALDAQRALAKHNFSAVDGLRVRIGLHAGHAQERDGDYFGPAVNRVARLMSVGHGGQVLLSAAVHELVKDDAPANSTFTDLGSHQLKDLASPERVWQVHAPGIDAQFPSLRSVASFPNNLPLQVTSFFGREHEIDEIKQHLADHRLVTILGAGGVGKTRLAVQAGAEVLDHYEDGVWIADLAPINEEQSVVSVVAQSLGVDQSRGALSHDSVARWLHPKQLLLILDDAEHLLDPIARLVDAIIRHCPQVRVLVTSRQALSVSGEKVFRLPSLAVPQQPSDRDASAAIHFGAVALFVDRASLVDRSFILGENNAATVADICRRLDGIPLAIELAAARLKTMSVTSLAHRLDERFKILTGGSRTALPRQQTLGALIDWSYDLLGESERLLFARAAVFAGGFTLDAATAVCAGEGLDRADILDLLCSLADKSLLVIDTSADDERYRLLESTRQYAQEKLNASGTSEHFDRANTGYYLALAREYERRSASVELSSWLARVDAEMENFRGVLEWALGEGHDAALGGSLAAALETFWWHAGVEAEGRYWVEKALAQLDAAAHPDVAGHLAQVQARLTSRVLFS